MRTPSLRILLAGIPLLLTACLSGCGVKVHPPEKPPTTAEIKTWSNTRLMQVEAALRRKDFRLPARVKSLIWYLRGLRINVTTGPGQKYRNPEEAVQALDEVIVKLKAWFDGSLGRSKGDSDTDCDQLQKIIDEAKEILSSVKVTEAPAS